MHAYHVLADAVSGQVVCHLAAHMNVSLFLRVRNAGFRREIVSKKSVRFIPKILSQSTFPFVCTHELSIIIHQ